MSSSDLLTTYLAEAATYSLLRHNEEQELLRKGRQGDNLALRRVIQSYLELTALIALKLAPENHDPIEAIQEANIALKDLLLDSEVTEPIDRLVETIRGAVGSAR